MGNLNYTLFSDSLDSSNLHQMSVSVPLYGANTFVKPAIAAYLQM